MGTHLILSGPSTAGKTSLMLGLAGSTGEHIFTIDRTITTRPRRPNETDQENIFVRQKAFEAERADFLFPFQTFPTYEYALRVPRSVQSNEVRMRILMPTQALMFRQLVAEPTLICSVVPYHDDAEALFRARDNQVDEVDLQARVRRYHTDIESSNQVADLHFQNLPGIQDAVFALRGAVLEHLGYRSKVS